MKPENQHQADIAQLFRGFGVEIVRGHIRDRGSLPFASRDVPMP